MTKQLEQEKEFSAWGLSKLIIRNIVVSFLVILCVAVVYLQRHTIEQDKIIRQCQTQNSTKVEQLLREMLQIAQTQKELEQSQEAIQRIIKTKKKK